MSCESYASGVGTVDELIAGLDEPEASALARIRDLAMAVAPEAAQGTSYAVPALLWRGKPLLGFHVARRHLSLYPFSPAAIDATRDQLEGLALSKGTVRFSTQNPPSDAAVTALVAARRDEIAA